MNYLKLLKPKGCFNLLSVNLKGKFHQTATCRKKERTFLIIKPDAMHRRLMSKVLESLEQRGYKLVAMKLARPSAEMWTRHYSNIADKPFFPLVLTHMQSGPVVNMVWEGKDIVNQGRLIIGGTDPLTAGRGTLRGDFGITIGRNIVHGSDSLEAAEKEINMWFTEEEIISWDDPYDNSIYGPTEK